MRVVFDSNVLIAALVFPGKQAEKAVSRIIEGRDQLLISKPIVDEVLGVLARKFARDAEELARAAVLLADLGEMVRPKRRIRVLRDDTDNRILECAVTGQADLIVTGDHDMLELGAFADVRVLSLRAYLES
ncbi:MAG: putative toxin-antitoxin system toxin component, PIN family [Candidatus Binataceae bacterium]